MLKFIGFTLDRKGIMRYFYTAKQDGEVKQGYISANDMEQAVSLLEQKGCIVFEVNEVLSAKHTDNDIGELATLNINEKKQFFNAFYFQYKSGLPLSEVFNNIAVSTNSNSVKMLALHLSRMCAKGASLNVALSNYSKVIGYIYVALIRVGERSGQLDETLKGIIQNVNKIEKIKTELIKKLTYPLILICLLIGSFLLFESVIFKIFDDVNNQVNPEIVKYLVHFLVESFVVFGLIRMGYVSVLKNVSLREKLLDKLKSIKIIKDLVDEFHYLNFFNVLSLSINAGVPIQEAISLSSLVIKTPKTSKKIDKIVSMVSQGSTVATAMGSSLLFSDYAKSQITSGEKSGRLVAACSNISKDYETSFNTKISVVLKCVEPIVIIFIALGVLYIGYEFVNNYFGMLNSL